MSAGAHMSPPFLTRFVDGKRATKHKMPAMTVSPARRSTTLDALRRGTVPSAGFDQLAVDLAHLGPTIAEELDRAAAGGAVFKAIRGEYGSGKTFTVRWIEQLALTRGLAVSELKISELETPLHRLEIVYRRAIEEFRTAPVRRSDPCLTCGSTRSKRTPQPRRCPRMSGRCRSSTILPLYG